MKIVLKPNLPEGKWWSEQAGQVMECDLFDVTMGYRLTDQPQADVEFYVPQVAVQTVIEDDKSIITIGLELLDENCSPERHGAWIDLKTREEIVLKEGQSTYIPLGVKMAIPKGSEGHLLPRSSTFSKFGILMTNSQGIIEDNYGEEWLFPVYATRDVTIPIYARIAQFRSVTTMSYTTMTLTTMEKAGNSHKGLGSTDKKPHELKKLK